MPECAAVITAAGLSSRMQRFKPLLPLGDSTIIGQTISTCTAADADPIVVVTGFQAEKLESYLRAQSLPASLRIVRNEAYASSDMFASVRLGLAALKDFCGPVFLTPADVPLVSPETCRALLSAAGAEKLRRTNLDAASETLQSPDPPQPAPEALQNADPTHPAPEALQNADPTHPAPETLQNADPTHPAAEALAFRPVYQGRGGHPLLLTPAAVSALRSWNGTDGLRGFFRSGAAQRKDLPVNDPAVLLDADTPDDYRLLLQYWAKPYRDGA